MMGMLKAVTDVKPSLSGTAWRWSPDNQFPPLEKIRHTPFWVQEDYQPLRDRLATEAPVAEHDVSGTYATIRTKIFRRNPTQEEGIDDRLLSQVPFLSFPSPLCPCLCVLQCGSLPPCAEERKVTLSCA